MIDSCYIGDHRIIMRPSFGGKLIVPSTDLSIMPDLILSGHIEPELCKWIQNNVKPGNVCFDVGANIGFITLLLGIQVGASGKIYSFEANPNAYEILLDNIAMNGLNAEAHNQAIWSEESQILIYCSNRLLGGSSVKDHMANYSDRVDTIVPALSFDTFCSEQAIDYIDFLKIDIEGAEYHAFLGMEHLLADKRTGTIVFEFSRWALGEDLKPFQELLTAVPEARFYALGHNGEEIEIDINRQFENGPNQNILMRL